MNELGPGDLVFLHDRSGRRYRVRLEPGASFSMHSGAIAHDALIGAPEGSIVTTNRGGRLLALRPTFGEQVTDRKRRAQPIYPKDLGAIVVKADVFPGASVVEAGTGTAALTLAAWRAVGPAGHVTSYELREEFNQDAVRAVLDTLGEMPPNLELRVGSVYDGIAERDVDRVLLDLPEPWLAAPHAKAALRPGGILFAHCPNVSQVERFCAALREEGGFGLLETVELLERPWTVRGRSTRPAHRMVAHTGFLTFARRIAADEVFDADRDGW